MAGTTLTILALLSSALPRRMLAGLARLILRRLARKLPATEARARFFEQADAILAQVQREGR